MCHRQFHRGNTLLVLLLSMGPTLVRADDVGHEEARRAVERGELRPLADILAVVKKSFPGKVVEVELEREDSGRYIYEIEVLSRDGRVIELEYDGKTGRQLKMEVDD